MEDKTKIIIRKIIVEGIILALTLISNAAVFFLLHKYFGLFNCG